VQDIQRSKASVMLTGVASIVVGLIFFSNPGATTVALIRLTGLVAVVFSVLAIVTALRSQSLVGSSVDLYVGVVALVFGLVLSMLPEFFAAWIFILLGIFVLIEGLRMFFAANVSRAAGMPGSLGRKILSSVVIVGGFLMMFSPFVMVSVAGTIAGIFLIANGISEIARGTRL
jgi:uncharacterized membrane protein HdeD (DUF308 family)